MNVYAKLIQKGYLWLKHPIPPHATPENLNDNQANPNNRIFHFFLDTNQETNNTLKYSCLLPIYINDKAQTNAGSHMGNVIHGNGITTMH